MVLIGIHVIILIHILHWLITGNTVSPLEPSESMEFSKHSIINAGFIFFALAILSTLIFGRFICGWACHLVALQDLCRWILIKMGLRPKPLRSKALVIIPYLAFVYMFLLPMAYRIWNGDPIGLVGFKMTTSSFWATFPGWTIGILTLLVCGFMIIYFLGAKGFCTYACPYGAIFAVMGKLAPANIRVTDRCRGCAHCTAVCTSNVRVHEEVRDYGMVVSSGCMKCLDCTSVCPNNALYYGAGKPAALVKPRSWPHTSLSPNQTWWEEMLLFFLFTLAFLSFRGLYGAIPFLFSLGLGAILAFLSLQCIRLLYKPDLSLLGWPLKRDGRLAYPGIAFLLLMVFTLSLWGHSGFIQYHAYRGERLYRETAAISPDWQHWVARPRTLSPDEAALVEKAQYHARVVRNWSLIPDGRNDIRLAWYALLKGEEDSVENHIQSALDHLPGNALLRMDVGNLYQAQGRLTEAGQMYLSAAKIKPDLDEAYFQLGNIEIMQDRTEKGLEYFRRAIEINPDRAETHHNLAGALCSLGRYEKGIREYLRAIEINWDDPETHFYLSLAYGEIKEWDKANQHREIAHQLRARMEKNPQ